MYFLLHSQMALKKFCIWDKEAQIKTSSSSFINKQFVSNLCESFQILQLAREYWIIIILHNSLLSLAMKLEMDCFLDHLAIWAVSCDP